MGNHTADQADSSAMIAVRDTVQHKRDSVLGARKGDERGYTHQVSG